MDEQQVRNIVRQEIAKDGSASRFKLTPVNRHTHNNVDAPFVFLPFGLFAGFIPSDGDLAGLLENFLPKGWTLEYDGVASYTLTHNLGTLLYSCVVTATQSTNTVVAAVVSPFENSVVIDWFLSMDALTPQATSFNFVLLLASNKSDGFPTYTSRNIV